QTQNLHNVTLSGNTAGVMAQVSSGTMTLAGGANITLSQNGNAITISGGAGGAAGSNTLGMSNLGNTVGTSGVISGSALQFAFAGGNNITLSQSINGSSGTITISAFNQSAQTQNLHNMTLSGNTAGVMAQISSGTMTLAGGNNITLSQNGNAVTISAFNQTVQTQNLHNMTLAGNSTSAGAGYVQISSGTLTLAGGNNITLSQNGNAVTIVGAAGGAGLGGIAANAASTVGAGTVVFSNSNGVSFGLNGSTMTASVATGGGAAAPMRWTQIPAFRFSLSNLTNITAITYTPFFQPFRIDGDLTLSRLNWEMSRSTSGSNSFNVTAGIYSYVNNSQISLLGSAAGAFSNSATASISGIRRFGISGFNVSTFAPGGYILGMMFDSGPGTASLNYSIRGHSGAVQLGAINEGTNNYNTATSYNIFPFLGRFSATTAAFPSSVADSQIRGQFSGASAPINAWIGFNND
ncbi:MAG: hypothetical protein AAB630_00435, partial [Patescibacteria group bacterium]